MTSRGSIFGARQAEQPTPEVVSKPPATKQRKKRSDAKNDIKFKLSASEKKQLKLLAADKRLSLTAFASEVIREALRGPGDQEPVEYNHSGQFIHAVLEDEFSDQVHLLSIEWDIPRRHVAHRIVKNYLAASVNDIKIMNYRRVEK